MANFFSILSKTAPKTVRKGVAAKAVRETLKASASRTGDSYSRYGRSFRHYSSGELYRSIKARFKSQDTYATPNRLVIYNKIEYDMANYGIYQSEGYQNRMSIGQWYGAIIDWVRKKGIARGDNAPSVAYAIAKFKSKQAFTPPSEWIKNAFEKKDFKDRIDKEVVSMDKFSENSLFALSHKIDIDFKGLIKSI